MDGLDEGLYRLVGSLDIVGESVDGKSDGDSLIVVGVCYKSCEILLIKSDRNQINQTIELTRVGIFVSILLVDVVGDSVLGSCMTYIKQATIVSTNLHFCLHPIT